VHKAIENGLKEQGDPNYIAEPSLLKAKAEAGARYEEPGKPGSTRYGDPGSIRVDVLENLPEIQMVCIYDIKTGKKALYGPRMKELAEAVRKYYSHAIGFIVIEVRPARK
jgi:hypothetical protein